VSEARLTERISCLENEEADGHIREIDVRSNLGTDEPQTKVSGLGRRRLSKITVVKRQSNTYTEPRAWTEGLQLSCTH
jgi:hypothetical protein